MTQKIQYLAAFSNYYASYHPRAGRLQLLKTDNVGRTEFRRFVEMTPERFEEIVDDISDEYRMSQAPLFDAHASRELLERVGLF